MIISNDLIIYQKMKFAMKFTIKLFKQGTIIQTETLWEKIPSWKSIEFGMTRYKQKIEKISRYKTTHLLQIWFFCLVSKTGQKMSKSEFVTTHVRIMVTITFT